MAYVIAYDLGTGGIKASIFDQNGISLADIFIQYDTYYPRDMYHEQRPMDWWDAVCRSTQVLLQRTGIKNTEICAAALSGHSLVAAPIDKDGRLLLAKVPIWSDMRSRDMTELFFSKTGYEDWYMSTGNGDPPACYSVFKLMWLREYMPDIYDQTDVVLGSKDFINFMLTGEKCTDPSYASGSGVFDLRKWDYSDQLIGVSGLPKSIFPPIWPSHAVIGRVTPSAANATGLAVGTYVACGGVDNSCMALGARGIGEGKMYTSLGSSSWIAVTASKPILDMEKRPFVFAHIEKGYYTSATSIFSAGNSFRWLRDTLCPEVLQDDDPYLRMNKWAENVPVGSNGLLFNPSLAGGSAQEKSPNIRGGFSGISLATTREDMVRACMEGIALNLKSCLDILQRFVPCEHDMLLCGGGSKSPLWRQIFADVYNVKIIKTNIDQNAASLGAAAIALRCCDIWKDYAAIESLHVIEDTHHPLTENAGKYAEIYSIFEQYSDYLNRIGDQMNALHHQ